MKLSFKLPLAFAVLLTAAIGGALFGMQSLLASIKVYQQDVLHAVKVEQDVAALNTRFQKQVLEWKNTLLRGVDDDLRARHWPAFQELETGVRDDARALLGAMPEGGHSRELLERFVQAHEQMSAAFHRGFAAFERARYRPEVGDMAVTGMDRDATTLLEEAGQVIVAYSQARADAAAQAASRATMIALGILFATAALGLLGGYLFSRRITRPLAHAVDVAQAVAAGNLAVAVRAAGRDETAQVLHALEHMKTQLTGLVGGVRTNAESVASASEQIAQGNMDLSGRTEQQAAALQQTAASMEELGTAVTQNADSAGRADALAREAESVALRGGAVVSQVVETMQDINESSRKIADIVGMIDSIAFQTNILALNAAVESARAGEQGRGFAVVANEVRSLSQRSAEAAREIAQMINSSVARVETGTALAEQAGATMTEVVDAIQQVSRIVAEISQAGREQSVGVSQVGDAVQQMDQTTQQNAALVEESAAAAASLKEQATELVRAVSVFRLNPGTAM